MQKHLSKPDTINLGSYYTPKFIVDIAYKMLENMANLDEYLLFDSSCGYGDFFIKNLRYLGADIDKMALQNSSYGFKTLHSNSLINLNRAKFEIKENEKLIIIGNPPYNDKTSKVKNKVKQELFDIDKELKFRDLGISFLRSYAVLKPDFVCVLHPLSYLIKQVNFKALAKFSQNYRLIDNLIISSEIFTPSSSTYFPIIIALYEKNALGMDYEFIRKYKFKTDSGSRICLDDFDFITNYAQKYPNLKDSRSEVGYFHTLRDINALKRNQTFMKKPSSNSVKIFADNLKYYCYIHHFKANAHKLPYYFGNLDVFIDHDKFLKIQDDFLDLSPKKAFKTILKYCLKDMYEYKIPLTKIRGRIKERLAFFEYRVAPTQTIMNEKHYIEWQIGYDEVANNSEYFHFVGANGKKKIIYELSEFLAFWYKNALVDKEYILNLKNEIYGFNKFISDSEAITRTYPIWHEINGLSFLKSNVSCPLLMYKFNLNDLMCEIIIKEKQRAVGVMPMLYFCIPILALRDENGNFSFLGRKINSKEHGVVEISKENIEIFITLFKIFGFLSKAHNYDCIQILNYILSEN